MLAALLLALVWSTRHRWSWPATWITGTLTSLLGVADQVLGIVGNRAAGLGVILTFVFGVMTLMEQRKRTRAVQEAAAAGTLHVDAGGEG